MDYAEARFDGVAIHLVRYDSVGRKRLTLSPCTGRSFGFLQHTKLEAYEPTQTT